MVQCKVGRSNESSLFQFNNIEDNNIEDNNIKVKRMIIKRPEVLTRINEELDALLQKIKSTPESARIINLCNNQITDQFNNQINNNPCNNQINNNPCNNQINNNPCNSADSCWKATEENLNENIKIVLITARSLEETCVQRENLETLGIKFMDFQKSLYFLTENSTNCCIDICMFLNRMHTFYNTKEIQIYDHICNTIDGVIKLESNDKFNELSYERDQLSVVYNFCSRIGMMYPYTKSTSRKVTEFFENVGRKYSYSTFKLDNANITINYTESLQINDENYKDDFCRIVEWLKYHVCFDNLTVTLKLLSSTIRMMKRLPPFAPNPPNNRTVHILLEKAITGDLPDEDMKLVISLFNIKIDNIISSTQNEFQVGDTGVIQSNSSNSSKLCETTATEHVSAAESKSVKQKLYKSPEKSFVSVIKIIKCSISDGELNQVQNVKDISVFANQSETWYSVARKYILPNVCTKTCAKLIETIHTERFEPNDIKNIVVFYMKTVQTVQTQVLKRVCDYCTIFVALNRSNYENIDSLNSLTNIRESIRIDSLQDIKWLSSNLIDISNDFKRILCQDKALASPNGTAKHQSEKELNYNTDCRKNVGINIDEIENHCFECLTVLLNQVEDTIRDWKCDSPYSVYRHFHDNLIEAWLSHWIDFFSTLQSIRDKLNPRQTDCLQMLCVWVDSKLYNIKKFLQDDLEYETLSFQTECNSLIQATFQRFDDLKFEKLDQVNLPQKDFKSSIQTLKRLIDILMPRGSTR